MSDLSRIGVALETKLLEKFDNLIADQGYASRSEAFRDLIRVELIEKAIEMGNAKVIGTISLVYDHHVRLLSERLTELQHRYHHPIPSTLHVYLDHDRCLEVIVASGKLPEVEALANALISTKGVKHRPAHWSTSGAEL